MKPIQLLPLLSLALLAPLAAHAQNNPPAAPAPAPAARVEVLVLEATMGDGGVAGAVSQIPQLRNPPFSAYSQIAVITRTTLPLGASASNTPVPGGAAAITLAGRSPEGRFSVNVAFTQGGATSRIEFVASAGEPFFTVRSSRPDRAVIIGFIVRP